MVLRSQSVGEQDVADQQGAFCVPGGRDRGGRRPPFLFLSVLRVCATTAHYACGAFLPLIFHLTASILRMLCP